MWPYWILFLVPAWLAMSRPPASQASAKREQGLWRLTFVLLALMIGLRHEVGGDWETYLDFIHQASDVPIRDFLSNQKNDFSYNFLNWLAASLGLGLYFVNTVCATIFSWGLVVFCKAQPRPWLALAVAVPYLVIVVAMGYTRQAVAIGLIMPGLAALSERKIFRFVIFIVLASTFHKTALILMPLAVLASSKNKFLSTLWIGLTFALFYFLLLQDSVASLKTNYIDARYDSSGAAIRVAMNAVPAVVFLWLRRRFILSKEDRVFWTLMSIGALGFVVLLYVSPSSTAVDRMALYWIPLQLFVFSRLPSALTPQGSHSALWVRIIVAYSLSVQFVWLLFAKTAFAWLPYQFYPWVALWN